MESATENNRFTHQKVQVRVKTGGKSTRMTVVIPS